MVQKLHKCLTWFVKLHMRIGSLDRIYSWIATRNILHKLHKVQNALDDLHKLLLVVRLGLRNLLLGLLKVLFLLLFELCNVGSFCSMY